MYTFEGGSDWYIPGTPNKKWGEITKWKEWKLSWVNTQYSNK